METIGKILSLTLLAIFGTAGTVIYFTDPGKSPSIITQSVSHSRDSESEPDNNIDYSAYKEGLSKHYFETENPAAKNSESQKQHTLWTNTYDAPSREVRSLAEGNSMNRLRENMNYWNNRYHEALRVGNRKGANDAYREYRNYKEAIEVKEAL
jgi:hypothetical protein